MPASIYMHGLEDGTATHAALSGNLGGTLVLHGNSADMMLGECRTVTRGEYRATLFMPAHRAEELARLWNAPGLLNLYDLLLREIDPRLLEAEPSPTGGLLYRRCQIARVPLAAPSDGWEWQHEDAEDGDPRHGVGTLADCLDEIDALHDQVKEAAE